MELFEYVYQDYHDDDLKRFIYELCFESSYWQFVLLRECLNKQDFDKFQYFKIASFIVEIIKSLRNETWQIIDHGNRGTQDFIYKNLFTLSMRSGQVCGDFTEIEKYVIKIAMDYQASKKLSKQNLEVIWNILKG